MLDLDHVGTLVGEQPADLVADDDGPEVDDPQPAERATRPPAGRGRARAGGEREIGVVLAGLRRAVAEAGAHAVDGQAAAGHAGVHAGCDLRVDERAAGGEVRAVQDLGNGQHRGHRDAAGLPLRSPPP